MAAKHKFKETVHQIEIPGISLYCRVLGNGPPIVFLHGFSQSNRLYEDIETRLACRHQLILLDSRGHGASGLDGQNITTALLAQDVVRVLDYLGIDRCVVIGFSDGANIALQLAIDSPQRLCGIVSISPNARPNGLRPIVTFLIKLWKQLLRLGCFLRIPSAVRLFQLMPLLQEQPQLTPDDLASIHVPALLVWAQRDFMTKAHIQEVSTAVPTAKTIIVKKAGHLSVIKRWPEYEKEILAFLASIQ